MIYLANNEIIIIIGCDVDPSPDPTSKYASEDDNIRWKGVTEDIPKLKEMLNSFSHENGQYPNITWLLRSDKQFKIYYDDYAYPVKKFWDIWKSCQKDGDELGWHPHLWDFDESNQWWYPRIHDPEWIIDCLTEGYKEITRYFIPKSVRMGWNFQSNTVMNVLNNLGIIVDFSALPKQKTSAFKSRKNFPICHLDWRITSEEFYYPSENDYRRVSRFNEKPLDILEMPLSLTQISFHRALFKYIYNNTNQIIDTGFGNPLNCFNLNEPLRIAKDTEFFKAGLMNKFKYSNLKKDPSYILTYFHPNELKPRKYFSLSNFRKNLELISSLSKQYDVPFRFLTATEAAEEYKKNSGLN